MPDDPLDDAGAHGPADVLPPEGPLGDEPAVPDALPLGLLPVPGIGTE